jgi:hypothetical protein
MRALLDAVYGRRRHLLLTYDLRGAQRPCPATVDVTFRAGTARDLDDIARDPAHEITWQSARRHRELLAADGRLLVGCLGGRIIYRGWSSSLLWRPGAGEEVSLGEAKGVIFRCYTVPEQRGRGVYAAALGCHLATLQRQGIAHVYINVDSTNIPSIRAIRKAGFASHAEYEVTTVMGRSKLSLPPDLRASVEAPASSAAPASLR